MGYSTNFILNVEANSIEEAERIVNILRLDSKLYPWEMGDWFNNQWQGNCKWYEHDVDMRAISDQFPTALFILDGEGEESGDIWTSYYKGGKSVTYTAEIIIAPFNEKDLR